MGYKTYIAMTDERILTAATVTTVEKADGKELKTLLYKTVNQGIIADTAYSGKENIKITQEANYHLIAKLNPIVSNSYRKKEDEFGFNKDSGMVVCPAEHQVTRKARTGKKNKDRNQSMTYYFDVEKCKQCPLRNGCYNNAKEKTYSITLKSEEHQYHLKQLNYYITPE